MKRVFMAMIVCLPFASATAETDPALAAGGLAAKTLMDALVPQLKASMQAGGPVAAVNVCANVAQQMTEHIVVDHPAVEQVSRVTDRARNPLNQAAGADLKVIAQYLNTGSKDDQVVRHDGETTYYKPLYLQELCLNCHGTREQMKPEVHTIIKKHYPTDQATGYTAGDFRGLIKVTINEQKLKENK